MCGVTSNYPINEERSYLEETGLCGVTSNVLALCGNAIPQRKSCLWSLGPGPYMFPSLTKRQLNAEPRVRLLLYAEQVTSP